jgi:hypothetical protein
MSDGGPNGYSIVEFDGAKYKVTFRAASRPETYQMGIYLPEQIPAADLGKTEVIVNVFAGSSRSTVEMRVSGGAWTRMQNFRGQDPFYLKLKEMEASPKPPTGLKLPGASETDHLWKGALPTNLRAGTHVVEVRTTDMFGQTYLDRRIVRVS